MIGCYVVAELGVNHMGSLDRALEMVRAAAAAGCNGVKIQAYTASEFVGRDETYTYIERDGKGGMRRVTERQREMFDRCALAPEDVEAIHAECLLHKLSFVATATDATWIERIKALGSGVMLKVGSDDIVHHPLLRAAAASKLPVILSTGMASEGEIDAALAIVQPLILLHCVSLYPTPVNKANLRRMVSLGKYGRHVGFSDHTEGTMVAMVAAGMGASMVEKHFTLDKGLSGPDHWFSADPEEMGQLVACVKAAVLARGSGVIQPGPEEIQMRKVARRSAVAALDIPAGTMLKPEMVAYRRPGTGSRPGSEANLLGLLTVRRIREGEPLAAAAFFSPGEVVH